MAKIKFNDRPASERVKVICGLSILYARFITLRNLPSRSAIEKMANEALEPDLFFEGFDRDCPIDVRDSEHHYFAFGKALNLLGRSIDSDHFQITPNQLINLTEQEFIKPEEENKTNLWQGIVLYAIQGS